MSNERKEGVLITAFTLLLLLTLSLITDWSSGFFSADLNYYGFTLGSVGYRSFSEFKYFGFTAPTRTSLGWGGFTSAYEFDNLIMHFSILYTTLLVLILPIFFYGVLRATGVVKRLFSFEKSLSFLFHEQESKQDKVA